MFWVGKCDSWCSKGQRSLRYQPDVDMHVFRRNIIRYVIKKYLLTSPAVAESQVTTVQQSLWLLNPIDSCSKYYFTNLQFYKTE